MSEVQSAVSLLVVLSMTGLTTASAQPYPSKVIRIVTTGAGGGNDFMARLLSDGMAGPLGQPVIVDNRIPLVASDSVAKAPPDGYTLMVHGGNVWVLPMLQKVPYDVVRDFSPISLIARDVCIVAVHPSMPVRSVKDLIALAKAKPGQLNYAVASPASTPSLAGELLKSMTAIKMVNVPYNGSAPVITALISGEAHATILDSGLLDSHMKSGRLRALAVTSAEPTQLFPGLPTVASVIPGYEYVGMTGIWAPAKTPAAIITRLNQEIVRLVNRVDVKERILITGAEPVASSPEQFSMVIKADIARKQALIKNLGIASN